MRLKGALNLVPSSGIEKIPDLLPVYRLNNKSSISYRLGQICLFVRISFFLLSAKISFELQILAVITEDKRYSRGSMWPGPPHSGV